MLCNWRRQSFSKVSTNVLVDWLCFTDKVCLYVCDIWTYLLEIHQLSGFSTEYRNAYEVLISKTYCTFIASHAAKHQLEELLQEWSSLLGLLILVVCLDAPEASLKHLVGVERGTDVMQDAFRKLGYATLRLPVNATGLQLRAMIKAASEAKYPDSYKRIFFHFIGHGIEGGVYTSDKHISLSEIVHPFKRIPQIPKVFILDCCRQFPSVPPFDSSLTAENTLIIYSTMPGCEAYAPTHAGPLMTEKLAELFCTEKSSITDIAIRLPDELNRFQLCPITMLQLNQPISLLKEQEDKSMFRLSVSNFNKSYRIHMV